MKLPSEVKQLLMDIGQVLAPAKIRQREVQLGDDQNTVTFEFGEGKSRTTIIYSDPKNELPPKCWVVTPFGSFGVSEIINRYKKQVDLRKVTFEIKVFEEGWGDLAVKQEVVADTLHRQNWPRWL